jgi:hypothetical protein
MRLRLAWAVLAIALASPPAAHGEDGGTPLPPGHPPSTSRAATSPQIPEDTSSEDPSLSAGTISVQVADSSDRPLASTPVTLGILHTSVAKGESSKRLTQSTDPSGKTTFAGLETGGGVAYRVMVLADGATFAAAPFQLAQSAGMRTRLHVYPVERDVDRTLVASQAILYAEVKDDRVQVEQMFTVYNFGTNAWVPDDLVLALPASFTGFGAQQGMTDIAPEAVPGRGVKLRGTFPPGQHVVEFRWQLPYAGEPSVSVDVGLPPHVAAVRVMAPSSREMVLSAEGFPAAQSTTNAQGQRLLVTERQLRRDDASLRQLRVSLRNLPTPGVGRIIATLLSAGAVALGFIFGARKSRGHDPTGLRTKCLDEIAALEAARRAGDIGPKTYDRARRELLDQLARTFVLDDKPPKRARSRKPG